MTSIKKYLCTLITTMHLDNYAHSLCFVTLQWHYDECDGVPNHRQLNGLFNRSFRRRSKETSKLSVTGLCAGNSPVTSGLSSQRGSNMENTSIWWCHHVFCWDRYRQILPASYRITSTSHHVIGPVPVKQQCGLWIDRSHDSLNWQ